MRSAATLGRSGARPSPPRGVGRRTRRSGGGHVYSSSAQAKPSRAMSELAAAGPQLPDAYERLLLDAIAGRLNLFVRSDEQEQAWRWVGPILDAWANDSEPPRSYASGSWGPAAASSLIARDGFAWAEEE